MKTPKANLVEDDDVICDMSKEEFEKLIGKILHDNGFYPSVTVEDQFLDGSTAIVSMDISLTFNGRLDSKTVQTRYV